MVEATINRVHSLLKVSREGGRAAGASLAILSDAAKFVFRGRQPSFAPVGEAFGVELPQAANRFNKAGNRKAYWLGPDEWLLEAPEENPVELFAQISNRLAAYSCALVDVSHRSDGLSLSGAKSGYILNHGCPLDLAEPAFPVGMCTRTILGKAPILLSRPEPDVFHVDVWRSFAPYAWSLLDEARQELAFDEALN
jgi:sarcosine oxidase subunit gamma